MKKITITIMFFSVVMFLFAGANNSGAVMTSDNYQIWADAISVGGGEDQTSNNYTLRDTLGEVSIGLSSSTNDNIRAGFREMEYYLGDEVLTLSLDSSSLSFGDLDAEQTKTVDHSLTVDTNAHNGVSVTYSGDTLTCSACIGVNTVSAMGSSPTESQVGTSQFGFNVIYSTGTSPIASSISPYNTTDFYAFDSSNEIINSNRPINATTFTIKYIANIDGNEKPGSYATTITYTATANF